MKTLLFLGCALAIVGFAPASLAKSPAEIQALARSTSVAIKFSNSVGSGEIVHRQGEVYTLVTNRHVVCGRSSCTQVSPSSSYQLTLPDGQKYQVQGAAVKLLGSDLDLAIIQFRSNRRYVVAPLAKDILKVDDAVYTAGFPREKAGFSFNVGRAIAVVNQRFTGDKGGYGIVYNADTLPGMSGGGVFNSNGELVAIHGYGDRYRAGAELGDDGSVDKKIGYNRGIPVRWLVQAIAATGINLGEAGVVATAAAASTADEHFIAGFNKVADPGADAIAGKRQAIQDFNKAIQLNPQYANAYFTRAYLYEQLGEVQRALSDYNQAIALDPKFTSAYSNRGLLKIEKLNDPQGALADYNRALAINSNYADAYVNRGLLKAERLKDFRGALADYNRAIAIDPNLFRAYYDRGLLKGDRLNDAAGALNDYNQAIALYPNYAKAYNNRGALKLEQLNDPQGALFDLERAIDLNPKFAEAYNNRALLKRKKLNDPQGALVDFDRAIALNAKTAAIYYNRGDLKYNNLNDATGAMTDFNRAIALDGNYAPAYLGRGVIKASKLNDRAGALADWRQAEKLFRAQGNTQIADKIKATLQKFGV
jgi:tetratricopeptide (TPR) repeat protein/S1-C subfamily serine protease